MSSELEFKMNQRKKHKKNKRKNILLVVLLLFIIIPIICLSVKGISSLSQKHKAKEEFIFNGYVYPMPEETDPDLLKCLKKDGVKTAYLTFDDGPNTSVTVEILDILRRYNVKATFFCAGSLIESNPQVARRIFDEGHLLANHSYSHNYAELYATKDSFMSQINKTDEIIKNITQRTDYPKIMRFPGGGFETGKYAKQKQEYKAVLKNEGYKYCDWNALAGDAEKNEATPESIINRIKSSSKGKEDIVILMHDAVTKKATASSLAKVLEYLISQGYTFDRLDNI